jgi:glycosyltransferase involved in cell wall biosynthesis
MRILILTQYFWPESFRINTFAQALRDAGADVTVLTGKPNYPDGRIFEGYRACGNVRESYNGIGVYRVPIAPRGRATGLRLMLNYASFAIAASTAGAWMLRGNRFDVVFVYMPSPITQVIPGIVLKHLKGARLVTWVQDLWPESLVSTGFVRHRLLLRIVDRLVRRLYAGNDLLLGQSQAFVTAIRSRAGGTPIKYLPNPGEAGASPAEAPPPLTLDGGFNVVFAGNLGTVQALDTVLDAAASIRDLPHVQIVLVGSGSRSAWLEAELARRGLTNVRLAGRYPASAMPGIYAQASALLVSLSRSEILSQTIPAKMQTYLAAGRPVLASLDGEGATLITESGAGYATAAEDAEALAGAIRRLAATSEVERDRMGTAARNYYERHFQPDVLAHRLLDMLRSLTGTPDREPLSHELSD